MERQVDKIEKTLRLIFDWSLKEDLDDTLLQKLLNALENDKLLVNGPSIDLMTSVFNSTEPNPHSLAFAFRLIQLLPNRSQLIDCTNKSINHISNSPPIVKEAALDFLTSCCGEDDFDWMLCNGFKAVWPCLRDGSIFVQRAAERTISTTLSAIAEQEKYVHHREDIVGTLTEFILEENLGAINATLRIVEERHLTGFDLNRLVEALVEISLKTHSEKVARILAQIMNAEFAKKFEADLILNNRFIELITFSFHSKQRTYLHTPIDHLLGNPNVDCNALECFMKSDKSATLKLILRCLGYYCKLIENEAEKHKILENSIHILRIMGDGTNDTAQTSQIWVSNNSKCVAGLLDIISGFTADTNNLDFASKSQLEELISNLLNLIEKPAVSSSTFHNCCSILANLLKNAALRTKHGLTWSSPVLIRLGETLNKKCFDMQWETRDTALEFIKSLLVNENGNPDFSKWLLSLNLHTLIWDLMRDTTVESYVRATCISALPSLPLYSDCWLQLKQLKKEQTSQQQILLLVQDLLQDEEAFVNRAAAAILKPLMEVQLLDYADNSTCQCLRWASICALDWQVKHEALKCWAYVEVLISVEPNAKTIDLLRQMGYLNVLAYCLNDCDRPVRLLAANMVKNFRLKMSGFVPTDCTESVSMETVQTIEPDLNREVLNRAIDEVVDIEMSDRIASIAKECDGKVNSKKLVLNGCQTDEGLVWNADLDKIIAQAEKSTDLYHDNLDNLLDDLLGASVPVDEESQVIDCY